MATIILGAQWGDEGAFSMLKTPILLYSNEHWKLAVGGVRWGVNLIVNYNIMIYKDWF